jgi:hypothetical protein
MSTAWGAYCGFGVGFHNEIFAIEEKANNGEQIMKTLNKGQAATVN